MARPALRPTHIRKTLPFLCQLSDFTHETNCPNSPHYHVYCIFQAALLYIRFDSRNITMTGDKADGIHFMDEETEAEFEHLFIEGLTRHVRS